MLCPLRRRLWKLLDGGRRGVYKTTTFVSRPAKEVRTGSHDAIGQPGQAGVSNKQQLIIAVPYLVQFCTNYVCAVQLSIMTYIPGCLKRLKFQAITLNNNES